MKEEILKGITDSITEKLGEENSSIIADDIGKLLTANTQTVNQINDLQKEIATLKDNNQKLITANGNLLQQIPSVSESDTHQSEEQPVEKKAFNFRSVFDKNGKFKNEL